MDADEPIAQPANHGFDSPTADVILRSSDDLDFRVHKLILSENSPIFEGMFALPPPSSFSPSSADAKLDDLPIVPVPEDSQTLSHLLRACYPSKGVWFPDLTVLGKVLLTAEKYSMIGIMSLLAPLLAEHGLADREPMRVYALACRFGLTNVAAVAAKASLKHTFPGPSFPELKYMCGQSFHDLITYRYRCSWIISNLFNDPGSVWNDKDTPFPHYWGDFPNNGCDQCGMAWFDAFKQSISKEAFDRCVSGSTVLSPDLLNRTFNRESCDTCQTTETLTALMEFCSRLAVIADREIAKVRPIGVICRG